MKALFVFFMLFAASVQALSQCDKKITWYSTKGEMYDNNGTLLDTKLDSIFLETDPQKLVLRFQSDNEDLVGTVKEKICDWKEPFKNGKTVYHTSVTIDGTDSNATFTIEANGGKIILSLDIEIKKERKFVIYIDRYKES